MRAEIAVDERYVFSAIFLIVAVLLQSGKDKGVSGAITGGSSETYFGKNKGKSFDKKLALVTTIVAIVFVVLALLAFITQDYVNERPALEDYLNRYFGTGTTTTSSTAGSTSTTDSSTTDSSATTTDSSATSTDSSTTTTDSSTTTTDSSTTTTDSSAPSTDSTSNQ